jgi:hypothetical protein
VWLRKEGAEPVALKAAGVPSVPVSGMSSSALLGHILQETLVLKTFLLICGGKPLRVDSRRICLVHSEDGTRSDDVTLLNISEASGFKFNPSSKTPLLDTH